MVTPTKLSLFNGALIALGETTLSDTGERVHAAQTLVRVYDRVVDDCLREGSWNFAMETIKVDSDTGVTPAFGHSEVFAKPSDWVRTVAVSSDEDFSQPLIHYYDDASFWSAGVTPIYIRYVSDDTGLGKELSRWTPNFTRYVELELAERTCLAITQNNNLKEQIMKDLGRARKNAKNKDAMDESQPKFSPPSSWTTSRGTRSGWGDRGNRNQFIG